MGRLPSRDQHDQTGAAVPLAWVQRQAGALLRGERIGLRGRDQDEVRAILRCAIELLQAHCRRRPCGRRRTAT